jgi:energy-coupling factor transporter ATP-binding protein EcfA2
LDTATTTTESADNRILKAPARYTEFHVQWFNPLEHLQGSERVGIIGLPGSGKSCCAKSLMYILRHLYGGVMVISGSETDNGFYGNFVSKLVLHNAVTRTNLTQFVNRQRLLKASDPGGNHQHSLLVLDDVMDDPRVLDNRIMRLLYKQGRHIQTTVYLIMQYAMDCRPWMRSTTSAVFLYANVNQTARKRIYESYGTLFRTFDEFESAFEGITSTGPNTAMVILLKGSLPIQQAVFWYKADLDSIPDDFVVGHPRLQEHCAERINPKSEEQMGLISCAGETEL